MGAMFEMYQRYTPKPTNTSKAKNVVQAIWTDSPQGPINAAIGYCPTVVPQKVPGVQKSSRWTFRHACCCLKSELMLLTLTCHMFLYYNNYPRPPPIGERVIGYIQRLRKLSPYVCVCV